MKAPTKEDIARVKGMGFLLNRGTQNFSGRIVPRGCVFSAEDLKTVTEIAEKFGDGHVLATVRLCVEITGIPYESIDDAVAFAEAHGLHFGGTGSRIRPVTACKGTTCIYGNYDTQQLARELYDRYYIGWRSANLPHKFKICVGGCPNSCMKPSLNDFGVEGHRAPVYDIEQCRGCKVCQVEKNCPVHAAHVENGKMHIDKTLCKTCGVCTGKCPFGAVAKESPVRYQIYVGGTWGKHTRMATALPEMVSREEIFPMLEKVMLWFKDNAYAKERLGAAIDRLGEEKLLEDLKGDALLSRKDEILAALVKARP